MKNSIKRLMSTMVIASLISCTAFASDEVPENSNPFSVIGDWFTDRGKDIENAASATGAWFEDRATDIQDAASATSEWVADASSVTGEWVSNAASTTGEWLSNTASATGEGITNATNATGEWISNTVTTAGAGITDVANTTGKWIGDRTTDVQNVALAVADWTVYSIQNFDPSVFADPEYYARSLEKAVLGEYSELDPTALSVGINIAASIANVDVGMDIRDLTYDIQHLSSGEIAPAALALDAVALVPVVGAVKYLKHIDTVVDATKVVGSVADVASDVGKTIDTITDVADAAHDAGKVADAIDDVHDAAKAAEVADDVHDATKAVEIVDDVHDSAKTVEVADDVHDAAKAAEIADETHDAAETADTVTDVADEAHDQYVAIKTLNENLENTVHPETGIEFSRKYVDLSDGRHLTGVFPEFDAIDEIELPDDLFKASFDSQKKYLIKELQDQILDPEANATLISRLTQDELDDIAEGVLPSRFVWHHNEKEGLMQLVDATIHDKTGHTGGMSIWGKGY